MIGILKEKSMHQYLKLFFEPDVKKHEIKIGPYYADILNDKEIIEVQTQGLNKLRDKITFYTQNYDVRVVYPISHIKHINLINENGEVKRRKSPKIGNIYDVIPELYRLKPVLNNDRIRLTLVLVDVEEQRSPNMYSRKRYSKIENYPSEIYQIFNIDSVEQYSIFLEGLSEEFTSNDLSELKKISKQKSSLLLGILCKIDCIRKIGKKGNSIIYKRNRCE